MIQLIMTYYNDITSCKAWLYTDLFQVYNHVYPGHISLSLSVYLSVCLSVCLSVYMFACLPAYLPDCLTDYLFNSQCASCRDFPVQFSMPYS